MNSLHPQTNLVKFINIQDYVINIDNQKWITVEFTVDEKVKVTSKDVLAIFPDQECEFMSSFDFRHTTAYEYMLMKPVAMEERQYKVDISLKGANGLEALKKYRFVYFNDFREVLGLSVPFKFITPLQKMVETSSLLNLSLNHFNNNEGDETMEWKPAHANKERREHWVPQLPSNVQEELLKKTNERRDQSEVEPYNQLRRTNRNNRKYKHNVQDLTNQVRRLAVQTQTVMPRLSPFPPRPPPLAGCSNCHRVGQLLRTQSELYLEIKNLAQKNDDLEKEVQNLKNQLELGQAAYQKLSVVHMHEREMKLQFQSAACQQIVCVYHHIFQGFDSFQRPIYSVHPIMQYAPLNPQQVMMDHAQQQAPERAPPTHNKQRFDDKLKPNNLKLKAIIGHQEETIRALTKKLAEYEKMKEPKIKVKAVVKDISAVEIEEIDENVNMSGGDANDVQS